MSLYYMLIVMSYRLNLGLYNDVTFSGYRYTMTSLNVTRYKINLQEQSTSVFARCSNAHPTDLIFKAYTQGNQSSHTASAITCV